MTNEDETINEEAVQTEGEQGEASLAKQLGEAEARAAEYLDNWRRATAELSNARKRMQREQAETVANAASRVLERLLPVLDDMDRAFDSVPVDQDDSDWVNGFRMIRRKLEALLQAEGVTPIVTEGQRFDPAVHYAVTHEAAEGFEEGQIIGEASRGYKLGERVLRPAMVRVAKGS